MTYERQFFQYLENLKRRMETKPLNLGGVASSGGGIGGPPGGFINYLPQSRVTYDKLEDGTFFTPASGMSLLDNLNHIRARLNSVEASGIGGSWGVQKDDVTVLASGVTLLNFENVTSVTDEGAGKVTIICDDLDDEAIHDNVAGEINAVSAKTPVVDADIVLIEDSEASWNKKKVSIQTLLAAASGSGIDGIIIQEDDVQTAADVTTLNFEGNIVSTLDETGGKVTVTISGSSTSTDNDAIHDNVTGEINAITEKASPALSDILLIEDSEASYAKKKIQITNLPLASGTGGGTSFPTDYMVLAYLSSNQNNIATATFTTVQLDTETIDVASEFNTSTYIYTASSTGYYQVNYAIRFASINGSDCRVMAQVQVDTTGLDLFGAYLLSEGTGLTGQAPNAVGAGVIHLSSGDRVRLQGYHNSGSNEDFSGNLAHTYLHIYRIA